MYILLFWKKVFMLYQLLEQKLANHSLHVLHFPMVFWPADEGWEISFLTVALKSSITKRKTSYQLHFEFLYIGIRPHHLDGHKLDSIKMNENQLYSYYPESNSSKPVWYTLKVIKTVLSFCRQRNLLYLIWNFHY